MAKYNEILVGRFNKFTSKLFGMKGLAPTSQLSGDVQMVHPFFHGRENRVLESWHTHGFTRNIAALAATLGQQRIRNPVGSNVIAIFELIQVNSPLADAPVLSQGTSNTDGTVFALGQTAMDPRGQKTTGLILSDSSGGAIGGVIQARQQASYNANGTYQFIVTSSQELPLLPGDVIEIKSGTLNQLLGVSWLWRERFLEDSERSQ